MSFFQQFGGLWKSAGSVALFAAAGLFVGGVAMPSAKAADLGGDCCADLEERVAELEATTVRKGNRRVSLTLYGWVNKAVMYWNDGTQSNTFMGVDNTNFATRFGLKGEGRANPNLKAGFSIVMDVITGGTTGGATQKKEDSGGTSCSLNGSASALSTCGVVTWLDDHTIRMRDANVYLDHTQLGRLTLGRLTGTGPQAMIDLGNVGMAASGTVSLSARQFFFRNSGTGGFLTNTIGLQTDNGGDFSVRVDGVRYDSPSLGGFVLGATFGEAMKVDRGDPTVVAVGGGSSVGEGPLGNVWSVNLRYAGEFAGFRVAAAVGYEVSRGEETMNSAGLAAAPGGVLTAQQVLEDSKNLGGSLSIMHVPSGLFAQAYITQYTRGNIASAADDSDTGSMWLVQAGISKNWFGIGDTSLYGEYGRSKDLFKVFGDQTGIVNVDIGNDYTIWGFGIQQALTSIASEVYLGYRNHSIDRGFAVTAPTVAYPATATVVNNVDDVHIVTGGMRISF